MEKSFSAHYQALNPGISLSFVELASQGSVKFHQGFLEGLVISPPDAWSTN
jgi:hypothetical protein